MGTPMRAREFITESTEREIAQIQYMQGECAVLALTIRNMNPQRYALGFVYEFFDSSPDMYLEPDEFDELDPARQRDIQYSYQNWTLTHAYVYDALTREYIDAEGRHKQLPMIGRSLNSTRHNKFPAETQDLVNVSHHMEWDEAQEKWIVLQGWDALDKAYTPEDKQRAREYAIKYLGIDRPAQAVAENFADGRNPVKFTVTTPDGYTHSFQITLAVHGKHVGHFNFVRGADTDDVNNEAEVEQRWQGQGYGKLLLMKAIDVANNHGLDFQQDIRGITDAQQNVYDSLENAGSIVTPGDGFWFLTPQGEQELTGLNENFADGRNPQDKGDSKRHGVPTKASVSTLRKVAKQGGRKGQLSHWLANMKAGRARAKRNK